LFKHVLSDENLIDIIDSKNPDTLQFFDVDAIRPKEVKTGEMGYKGFLFRNKLAIDAGYYYSIYKHFIGYKIVIDPVIDYVNNLVTAASVYRVAANSKDVVTTQGFS